MTYKWERKVGTGLLMGPPAPKFVLWVPLPFSGSCDTADWRGQEDSCQISHGTHSWQRDKSSGGQTLVMIPSVPQWWGLWWLVAGHRSVGAHLTPTSESLNHTDFLPEKPVWGISCAEFVYTMKKCCWDHRQVSDCYYLFINHSLSCLEMDYIIIKLYIFI